MYLTVVIFLRLYACDLSNVLFALLVAIDTDSLKPVSVPITDRGSQVTGLIL
jgi:hypothetical protein